MPGSRSVTLNLPKRSGSLYASTSMVLRATSFCSSRRPPGKTGSPFWSVQLPIGSGRLTPRERCSATKEGRGGEDGGGGGELGEGGDSGGGGGGACRGRRVVSVRTVIIISHSGCVHNAVNTKAAVAN